jgi:hypothetical protein
METCFSGNNYHAVMFGPVLKLSYIYVALLVIQQHLLTLSFNRYQKRKFAFTLKNVAEERRVLQFFLHEMCFL